MPSVVVPKVKLEMPVNVPNASSVPDASVASLMVVPMAMFDASTAPGNCPTLTVPTTGSVVVLLRLRFHWVASAISPGDR